MYQCPNSETVVEGEVPDSSVALDTAVTGDVLAACCLRRRELGMEKKL
jgi:hypothetical protein